jgi:hypothetical protein
MDNHTDQPATERPDDAPQRLTRRRPGPATTVINVKGVRLESWEKARRGWGQAGGSMGAWLSDAIDLRAAYEEGRVKPPGNPPMTAEQITARIHAVAALQQSAAAMKQAQLRGASRALKSVQTSLEVIIGEAEGGRILETTRRTSSIGILGSATG